MEKPNLPIINKIEAAVAALREAEQEVKKRSQEIRDLGLQVGSEPLSEGDLQDALNYIYWNIEELPVSYLSDGLDITVNEFKRRLCRVTANFFCKHCDAPIGFSQRQDLKAAQRKGGHEPNHSMICPRCERSRNLERDKVNRAAEAQEAARKEELRTMPYSLYLLTPEWKERREMQLRSAKHSCQVCNAKNVILNVHHRTYERRGAETFKDLIVLCRDCHSLFHREGKLAK